MGGDSVSLAELTEASVGTQWLPRFYSFRFPGAPGQSSLGLVSNLARLCCFPMVLSVSIIGTKRASSHQDSLLTKCGYLLRPAHEGGFIFRALYSGCFVQKEVGLRNYLVAVLGSEVRPSRILGYQASAHPRGYAVGSFVVASTRGLTVNPWLVRVC